MFFAILNGLEKRTASVEKFTPFLRNFKEHLNLSDSTDITQNAPHKLCSLMIKPYARLSSMFKQPNINDIL